MVPQYHGDQIALAFATTGRSKDTTPVHSLQENRPLRNADGTITCFLCDEIGYTVNQCPKRDQYNANGTRKAVANVTCAPTPAATPAQPPAPLLTTAAGRPAPWSAGVPLSISLSCPTAQ